MSTSGEESFTSVVRPEKLSVQIEAQLQNAINKGVFAAGELLPSENKLMEIFHVSRGVIREALLLLSAKGIVEIHKGKGALVRNPSIEPLLDSYASLVNYRCGNNGIKNALEARIVIEPQVATLAAELRSNDDVVKLGQCLKNMEDHIHDRKQYNFHDVEFHRTISQSCGNPMFTIILDPIFHFLQTYHQETIDSLISHKKTLVYHRMIFEAIKNKNSGEAFDAMKEHLSEGLKDVNKLFNKKNT